MKLPPFTLVYRPDDKGGARKAREARLVDQLKQHSKGLPESLLAVRPALRGALLRTVERSSDLALSSSMLSRATQDLRRQPKVEVVGLWDLSSQVGELPRVIEALNASQAALTFFEIQAAVPSGLISRPERVIAWAEGRLARPLSRDEAAEIGNNVIYEDFAPRARTVRKELGLDHLVGFAPAMIALEEEGEIYWNYFSMAEKGISLVSTYGIYAYARRARRPFEVAVAGIALSSLLATLNPKIEFHEENRGCLFDFNRDRDSLVATLRRAEIEPACLARIEPKYREAAVAMVAALRALGAPPKTPPSTPETASPATKKSSSSKTESRPRTRVVRKG